MGSSTTVSTGRFGPLAANRGQASTAERLGALHRSSGALTHDLNNLLGVILGANERLAAELGEGSELGKLALLALEAAERGAELLRRGLAVAQDPAMGRAEAEAIEVRSVLDTVQRMARGAVAPGAVLKICAPAQALRCAGDRTGLDMALLNLCINAAHATPGGGQIVVQAREARLGAAEAMGLGVAPGAYVAFSVRDTGVGMSPATLGRATDPLFTTKLNGTGLGLCSVVDFAASADGALALHSREGHGTTAILYLPIVRAAGIAAAA